jgi:adenine-specific DNA-methyltransferase
MSKGLNEYTKEELIEVVEGLKRRKKFGLVWEDKPELVAQRCKNELPVIVEIEDKALINSDVLGTDYILEGDNYHTLSVLNYTHGGKIDFIYIDPPYNTGNKEFKYNDRIVDKEDTFRHSKWLSFISKRLNLAKDLLRDEGVIFISIDDNEYANLKLLCDNIFGEENCIGPFIQNKVNGKTVPTLINKKVTNKEVIKENNTYFYLSDPITTRGDGGTLHKRKNLGYTIYYNPETGYFKGVMDYDLDLALSSNNEDEVYTTDDSLVRQGYICIRPPRVRRRLGAWTWDCSRFNDHLSDVYIKTTRSGYTVHIKKYVDDEEVFEADEKYYFDVSNKNGNSKSIIEFSTNDGTDEYNQILEPGTFNNPKNVEMLKFFVGLYDKKDALILDFFAGSGTTGQAVLELNQEDEGNRRFILCTNNENGIAENITYERIKGVIDGYSDIEGIPANIRYFRTDFVSKQSSDDQTRVSLVVRSTEMICLREGTFKQVTDTSEYKVFEGSNRYSAVVFDPMVIDSLKDELRTLSGAKPVHIYVFSLSNDTYEADFADLENPHELVPIPESILEVYRRIFANPYERLGM